LVDRVLARTPFLESTTFDEGKSHAKAVKNEVLEKCVKNKVPEKSVESEVLAKSVKKEPPTTPSATNIPQALCMRLQGARRILACLRPQDWLSLVNSNGTLGQPGSSKQAAVQGENSIEFLEPFIEMLTELKTRNPHSALIVRLRQVFTESKTMGAL
jgi:hypothetical protein